MEHHIRQLVQQRVNRGVKLLDECIPNWQACVQVQNLSLGDPRYCILGQLSNGNYIKGRLNLGLSTNKAITHGFNISIFETDYTFNELTQVWLKHLTK